MKPIDQLKSVLCGPDGKCCITGSDADREIVDRALQALAQPSDSVEQRPCRSCNGIGMRDTGIDEAPTAICKPCSGTGQIHITPTPPKREWVGLTDADIFEAEFNRPELMTIGEFISNKLKGLNHG